MANGYKKIIRNKNLRLSIMKLLRFVPDSIMLKIEFWIKLHKRLDLEAPQTFNEKLQWLKLHDRRDVHTTMVDKIAVKEYLRPIIGAQYIIKTLGVWESFDAIDFNSLPQRFVLKCNHDSGSVVVCRDKDALDMAKARSVLTGRLNHNAYYFGREWPYKNVKPKIFAEEYIEDAVYECLPVYKILCFNGEPKIIQTIQNDKQPNESVDYFDCEWNRLNIRQDYPNSIVPFAKPGKLEDMLKMARLLSREESFIRVDFYVVNNQIYFSEFTFFTDSGFGEFYPEEWDRTLGKWLVLPGEAKTH